jgi:tRNA nucleotidyltransferase (CCA-adding enzyme)
MSQSLVALLTPNQRRVYDTVRRIAQREQVDAYIVGGAVRDWLMQKPIGDLDIVLTTDAIHFARAVQRDVGGSLQEHERFRTATWHSHGLHTDMTTARIETYARPAALPSVTTPATIEQDLLRRDFSVNAMALRLGDETLLDPLSGQADLQQRTLRALHAHSFSDDPTRILRAARYAARLGFALDAETQHWLNAGLPYVKDLSGERVKYDVELIFELHAPERALRLIYEWGVFKSAGIVLPDPARMEARFAQARTRLAAGQWDMLALANALGLTLVDIGHAVGWSALTYHLGQLSASRWIEWIPFTTPVREALLSLGVLSTLSAVLFGGRASQQSEFLKTFSGLALFLGWLFEHDEHKRQAMYREWHVWRDTQPVTTGDDLRARGLAPGPRYRELLSSLRNAWLDGSVQSAEDEYALLERLLNGHDE